ncbi:MAG: autotransporter-associated beta strand repeat-containing protein [Opitutaceae bacterium]
MKLLYIIGIVFSFSLTAFADYVSDRAAITALGNLTAAPTLYEVDTSASTYQSSNTITTLTPSTTAQTLEAIFFDSVDYLGNPTRVYAFVGMPAWDPATDAPLPAIVLVHGGAGMAYDTWANLWAERGYVAIAIDTEGASNTTGRHNMGGPRRTGVFNESSVTIGDQFMFHATAGSILANSLLRSLSFVDDTKVGIHGVSWGGVITSNVIGVDSRFAFAIPTYGCGHMWDGVGKWQEAISNAGGTEYYKNVWDPMHYLENATMPIMWLTWLNDSTFNLDCQANSYNKAPGTRMVSMIQGMRHSHAFAWSRADSYDFADSIVGNNPGSVGLSTNNPWCVQKSLSLVGDQVTVEFESTRNLTSATLYHSNQMGDSKAFSWTTVTLTNFTETFSDSGIWQGTATLPSDATAWFVNVTATTSTLSSAYLTSGEYTSSTVYASSRLQEVVDVQQPSPLALTFPSGASTATGAVSVDFTAIYNLEITSIDFINETHPGAFSTDEPFTFGLLTNTAFDVSFDNAVAGLAVGGTATATLRLTWVALDNVTTDTIDIPLSATVSNTVITVFTWDGGGINNRWTEGDNWVDSTAPPTNAASSDTDVIFSDVGGRTTANTYSDYTLRSLTFDGSIDDAFTVNVFRSSAFVRTLTFDHGGSAATVSVDADSDGDILISDFDTLGSIILNDSLDVVHNGAGILTFDLVITEEASEANGITSSGSGSVVLSGANIYTGDTTVEAGTLTIAAGSSLAFVPTAAGVSNQLAGVPSGTGTVNLNGEININLGTADSTWGNSWALVDDSNFNVFYDAGTFSVNSSLGTFTNNTGVWTLTSGGDVWIFTQSTGILEVSSAPYETWAESSFAHPFTDSGILVDFDGDGLNNLLEFVFGGDPTISQEGIAPAVSDLGSDLQFTFRRSDVSKQAPVVGVKVETSEDLAFTTTANDIEIGSTSDSGPIGPLGASYTVANSGGFDLVTVTIPMGSIAKNFVRLVVTQP